MLIIRLDGGLIDEVELPYQGIPFASRYMDRGENESYSKKDSPCTRIASPDED